ncbi:MAG TPA: heme-binding domain-containing protein [Kofleriaceae bacterium]
MTRWLKRIGIGLGCLIGLFLVMQVVPYGRTHDNPRITAEPAWDSPKTRELAKRACFDCHSNETRWPWYASVAPMSWVVQRDVEAARETLNFSEWDHPQPLAEEAGSSIVRQDMPPRKYMAAHPEANLTQDELEQLARSLNAITGSRANLR